MTLDKHDFISLGKTENSSGAISGDMNDMIRASIIQDLEGISLLFNQFLKNQHQFLPSCRDWMNCRKSTIELFDEFQKEFITAVNNSTVGSGLAVAEVSLGEPVALGDSSVGSGINYFFSSSLASVTTFIRTTALENVKGKLLPPWKTCTRFVGSFSNGIACENLILENKRLFADINNALREDQLQTQMFYPWLQKSQEMEILFQRVFGCSVLSETLCDIFNAIEALNIACEENGPTLKKILRVLDGNDQSPAPESQNYPVLERVIQHSNHREKRYLLEFCANHTVRQAMLSVLESIKSNPSVFQMAKSGVSFSDRSLNMKVEYEGILLSLSSSNQDLFHSARQLTQDVLLAVPLAICVWSFISDARDVLEEKSKYMNMLDNLKKCLLNELNFLLKELYKYVLT